MAGKSDTTPEFISTAQDWTYTSISADAVRAEDIVKRHLTV